MLRGIARYIRRHHVALAALFIALGGTAYALGRNDVKSKHIAPDAVTNKHTKNLIVSNVESVAAFAGSVVFAPHVTLLEHGPFTIQGACGEQDGNVTAGVRFKITDPEAIGTFAGVGANATIHPKPGQLPQDFFYNAPPVATNNDYAGKKIDFSLISDLADITGSVDAFAKNGDPPQGTGPYGGAGSRCVFQAEATKTG